MVTAKKLTSMRLKKIEIVFGTKKFLIRMRNQMTFWKYDSNFLSRKVAWPEPWLSKDEIIRSYWNISDESRKVIRHHELIHWQLNHVADIISESEISCHRRFNPNFRLIDADLGSRSVYCLYLRLYHTHLFITVYTHAYIILISTLLYLLILMSWLIFIVVHFTPRLKVSIFETPCCVLFFYIRTWHSQFVLILLLLLVVNTSFMFELLCFTSHSFS